MKTITIKDGKVSTPCHSCGSVTTVMVKQRKGNGTHDAIKLQGKKPKPQHLRIMQVLLDKDDLTAEQIRYRINKKNEKKISILQSHFQRYHSELLYWKIIQKKDDGSNPPVYRINETGFHKLNEKGVFS